MIIMRKLHNAADSSVMELFDQTVPAVRSHHFLSPEYWKVAQSVCSDDTESLGSTWICDAAQ